MIRPARPGDALAIARIHVDGWRAAYAGMIPDTFLDSLSVEERAERWDKSIREAKSPTLVHESEGEVTGWIAFGNNRDDPSEHEIRAIYVAPADWRKGVGQALMGEAEDVLMRDRRADIVLWVLEDNLASIAFYRRLGYDIDGASKDEDLGGKILTEVRMRKPG